MPLVSRQACQCPNPLSLFYTKALSDVTNKDVAIFLQHHVNCLFCMLILVGCTSSSLSPRHWPTRGFCHLMQFNSVPEQTYFQPMPCNNFVPFQNKSPYKGAKLSTLFSLARSGGLCAVPYPFSRYFPLQNRILCSLRDHSLSKYHCKIILVKNCQ